jgi:hypothetical protein
VAVGFADMDATLDESTGNVDSLSTFLATHDGTLRELFALDEELRCQSITVWESGHIDLTQVHGSEGPCWK